MKYFEVTAYTPYCGEELTEYMQAQSEEELYTSGKIDDLIADCIDSFMDSSDYEDYGFESAEDWEEYYYEGAGANIQEITEEYYKQYVEKGW